MWQRTKFGVAMGVVLVGVAVGIAFAAGWLSVRSIDDEVRVRLARGERLSSSRWGEVEKLRG